MWKAAAPFLRQTSASLLKSSRQNQKRLCSASTGVPYEAYKADEASLTLDAPDQADVVILGGGVSGCATLYQLAKAGITNAVLLEKDALTAGTTWHTAGLVWSLRPSDIELELMDVSKRLMSTVLEEETGVNTGWINNGGLFIASTKERLDEYKRLYSLGKAYGVESQVLGPEETKKLYPLMNVNDIYGTLYSPEDGTIDPAGYCNALTRGATRRGAKVLQKCEVNGIQTYIDDYGTKRVKAVETNRGIIRTNTVVNAAGVWAPYLGAMAGVNVPLIAMHHAYVVTERIEGIQNMPNVRDHDASVYLKLQGDALSVGGYEQNPIFWEQVEKDFSFSLFELDWDVFSFNIEGAINRVPAIENTGVKSTVCGPESFTADHKPLMGESPEVRGYYLNCAYNSSGMMLSGGCSEQMARWIIDGKPALDMFGYDIRRFNSRLTGRHQWIKERSHEAYAKNYAIVFPFDEPLACRNQRKDALYEVLSDAGCVFQERHGWERPGWFSHEGAAKPLSYDYYGQYGNEANANNSYSDRLKLDYTFDFPPNHKEIGEEALGCRESIAAFDMSYFGKYYLTGPDAQKAVDWIFSNDMTKPNGSTVYTCMLNCHGKTEADLTVSMLDSGDGSPHSPLLDGGRGFYLAIGGAIAQHVQSHIEDAMAKHKWRVRLIDHTDDMAMISVQGPNSRKLLQSLTEADLSDEAFAFSSHQVISVAGHPLRALRLSFVGELGWELHIPNESAVAVHKAIMAAGEQYNIKNAGYRAIDSLSIEKGYRHWHADLRADDTPLESALAFTCKLKTDTRFQGRDALLKQKAEGLKKKIACFTIDEHVLLHGLECIFRDGIAVGFIRRAEFAFALGKSVAYGYVRHPEGGVVNNSYLKSGTYTLEKMGNVIPATIHMKSPFDPKNNRVKGFYDEPLPIRR